MHLIVGVPGFQFLHFFGELVPALNIVCNDHNVAFFQFTYAASECALGYLIDLTFDRRDCGVLSDCRERLRTGLFYIVLILLLLQKQADFDCISIVSTVKSCFIQTIDSLRTLLKQ